MMEPKNPDPKPRPLSSIDPQIEAPAKEPAKPKRKPRAKKELKTTAKPKKKTDPFTPAFSPLNNNLIVAPLGGRYPHICDQRFASLCEVKWGGPDADESVYVLILANTAKPLGNGLLLVKSSDVAARVYPEGR